LKLFVEGYIQFCSRKRFVMEM